MCLCRERERESKRGGRKKSKGRSTLGKNDGMQHDRRPFQEQTILSVCVGYYGVRTTFCLFETSEYRPFIVVLTRADLVVQCISQISVQLYFGALENICPLHYY